MRVRSGEARKIMTSLECDDIKKLEERLGITIEITDRCGARLDPPTGMTQSDYNFHLDNMNRSRLRLHLPEKLVVSKLVKEMR